MKTDHINNLIGIAMLSGLVILVCSCSYDTSYRTLSGETNNAPDKPWQDPVGEQQPEQIVSASYSGSGTVQVPEMWGDPFAPRANRDRILYLYGQEETRKEKRGRIFGDEEGLVSYAPRTAMTNQGFDPVETSEKEGIQPDRFQDLSVSVEEVSIDAIGGGSWSEEELDALFLENHPAMTQYWPDVDGEELTDKDDLRMYTALIIYYEDVVEEMFGATVSHLFRELASEANRTYEWSLEEKEFIEESVEDEVSLNDRDSGRRLGGGGHDIPGVKKMTLEEIIEDQFSLSGDLSVDPIEQKVDYGLTLELLFLPGQSEIYLNGPEESMEFSMALSY